MSWKRLLVASLDRPGGRFLLGTLATAHVRNTVRDASIFFEQGLWHHRVGPHCFPDGPRFSYFSNDLPSWERQAEQMEAQTGDLWLHDYQPRPGDVIVDVGAGRGEDALAFSRGVGPTGRVIAIEPSPRSFAILSRFCAVNGLANVTCVHQAILDKPGRVGVTDSIYWQGNEVIRDDGEAETIVSANTLDELCETLGLKEISFLKMNIEGAEVLALQGMAKTMDRVRAVCISCHDFRAHQGEGEQYRTRPFVEEHLARHGFKVRRRDDPRDCVRDQVFGSKD